MKKVFNLLKEIFFIVWGLPQNLIGLVMFLVLKKKRCYIDKNVLIIYTNGANKSAVSLGKFIFIFGNTISNKTLNHEKGHCLQSNLLGVFYLLVIGLPSIIWAKCFKNYRVRNQVDYDWFYTERWATYWGEKYFK